MRTVEVAANRQKNEQCRKIERVIKIVEEDTIDCIP
jgi:hypothetical protein